MEHALHSIPQAIVNAAAIGLRPGLAYGLAGLRLIQYLSDIVDRGFDVFRVPALFAVNGSGVNYACLVG